MLGAPPPLMDQLPHPNPPSSPAPAPGPNVNHLELQAAEIQQNLKTLQVSCFRSVNKSDTAVSYYYQIRRNLTISMIQLVFRKISLITLLQN